jgi:pimeloyl-ACP methyl ester carboxylesterase
MQLTDELSDLKAPTLFVWGDKDAFVPMQYGVDAARRMPDGEFHTITDAGHVVWLDQPAATAGAINEFLDR